jgi:hypothetical protein
VWTTSDVIGWLQGLGVTVPLYPGTQVIPQMPDRIGVVTPTSGPGQSLEGAADTAGFQLRVRGAQNNPGDAEALAYDADSRILTAAFPATIGPVRLVAVRRSGGRPTPLSATPDNGGRTEMVCTYLTTIMEA